MIDSPTGARPALDTPTQRLLTPTKITAWLDCDHSLTLQHRLEAGTLELERHPFGSFAQLLFEKGQLHERQCLEQYRADGRSILEVRQSAPGTAFEEWVAEVGDPFAGDHDVIFQLPLMHDGIRGIADFVERVVDPVTGAVTYEPVDAKLARAEAKPGHVLQLCFYAEAIETLTGVLPEHVHLWLGSGKRESIRTTDVMAYWRRIRLQLKDLLAAPTDGVVTRPVPCDHCEFCNFAEVCTAQWRDEDSLVYVARLRSGEREALVDGGVASTAALAAHDPTLGINDVAPVRLGRLVEQADLQVERRSAPDEPPPFRVIEPGDDPTWGHGFEHLPAPDDGDLFLDFEGHPFWRPDGDLFFLFGWIETGATGEWEYRTIWAHDRDEEAAATAQLIEHLAARRIHHPGMHVYHYNHTERSSLVRLAALHDVDQSTLDELIETGAFVDLMLVARNAVQVGTETYGLKDLERVAGFRRDHDIAAGAGAVIEYESYMATGDAASLERIADYNHDDVLATLALREWLVEQRPAALEWRTARLEATEVPPELDEQVRALHANGAGSDEHFLGDVLGYWRREWLAHKAQTLSQLTASVDALSDNGAVVSDLTFVGQVERVGANDNALGPGMGFTFPSQEVGEASKGSSVMFVSPDGPSCFASIDSIDPTGSLVLTWNDKNQEAGVVPDAIVVNDWVPTKPKPEALSRFAAQVLDPMTNGEPNPLTLALLRRDLPRFTGGHRPVDAGFSDDLDDMCNWVGHLDHSVAAVQGPPGTGKTYSGAHLVRRLILDGQRVGVTAFSHNAIHNFLDEVVDVFTEHGGLEHLHGIQKIRSSDTPIERQGITQTKGKVTRARQTFNLVAGTSWLFAGQQMADNPVDVLIVDEAGQLALADALAASTSARNLILLGDPLQLAQVSKASHPNRSGCSVLEHLLDGAPTMPVDRGVFLSETRRMHPDVCRFISDTIYEGRLTSHPDCARQDTAVGTGLRWLRADHSGRSTESIEEAVLVAAEVDRLVGTPWVNSRGESTPLRPGDIMVVTPYNNQRRLMQGVLDAQPGTRGVRVGTVDKFQGQEAAVVFFTMTASTAANAPRGTDFLFSRHRLNVAVSRARCLTYLVCTEELVNSRARDVDEMRLIATLCSFVEHSTEVSA